MASPAVDFDTLKTDDLHLMNEIDDIITIDDIALIDSDDFDLVPRGREGVIEGKIPIRKISMPRNCI